MSPTPTHDERIAIAHEPDGETARRFAEVIAQDPALQAELAAMRQELAVLRTEPAPPGELETARARTRFLFGSLSPDRPLERHLPRLAAAFGGLMLVLMLAVWLWVPAESEETPPQEAVYLPLRPAHADAQPLKAPIRAMQGEAAWRVGQDTPKSLTPELILESGIAVNLDKGASFFAELRPGLTALVNEAILTFVRLDDKDVIIDLLRGSVALKVPPLKSDQTVIVRTPELAVAVTGTEFAVAYSPETGNAIVVREGRVAVVPHEKPKTVLTVDAGYVLLMDANLTAMRTRLKKPDNTDRFFHPPDLRDWGVPLPGQQVQHRVGDPSSPPPPDAAAPMIFKPPTSPADADLAAELLAEARKAQGSGRFDEALNRVEQLLERHPQSPQAEDAHYLKAENLIGLGQVNEALRALEDVEARVTRQDIRQAALYTRGHLLQERVKDLAEARKAWSEYIARYPDGTLLEDAMFGLCANRSLAGDHDGVMEHCTEFAIRFGKSAMAPQAVLLTGDAAWNKEDYGLAFNYYSLYTSLDRPERRAEALLRQAEALIRLERPNRAMRVLNSFFAEFDESHPKMSEARRMMESLQQP